MKICDSVKEIKKHKLENPEAFTQLSSHELLRIMTCLLLLLCFPYFLSASDALSYGLQMKNSEYIRKALLEKSQKDLNTIFSETLGENIAQTYIEEAFHQPLALVRLEGFLGGLNPSNASSALYLEKALEDPNEIIRSFARRSSMNFCDSFIQQKLLWIIRSKKGAEKLEAFSVLTMQNKKLALEEAKVFFKDQESPLLEKIQIHEILSEGLFHQNKELKSLLEQNMITEESRLWIGSIQPDLINEKQVLEGLQSNSILSQLGALECIGLWKNLFEGIMEQAQPILAKMLISSNYRIKANAAWACFCQIPSLKEEAFSTLKLLSQIGDTEAELVSGVLCRSGINGLELSAAFSKDPYAHQLCRLNATLNLLRYRTQLDKTPFELLTLLKKINRPLQFEEHLPGRPVLFQTMGEEDLSQQIVLLRDIEVRCFLLGLALNSSDSPELEHEAYIMAEGLLKKKSWGPILDGGSNLFLQVGPKSIAFAQKLAQSFHEEVRIQTAGILAALGCQKEALDIIEISFPTVTFDGKMTILALLPQFPFQDALPFLISALKDKSSLIRTRAAGVYLLMKYRY